MHFIIEREPGILQGTYFLLVEAMPGKYRKTFVFNFNCSIWL